MQFEDFLLYLGFIILGLVIYGLIIRWAVRADTIVNNQKAIIASLIKQCRQQGVSEDEIDGLKKMFGFK